MSDTSKKSGKGKGGGGGKKEQQDGGNATKSAQPAEKKETPKDKNPQTPQSQQQPQQKEGSKENNKEKKQEKGGQKKEEGKSEKKENNNTNSIPEKPKEGKKEQPPVDTPSVLSVAAVAPAVDTPAASGVSSSQAPKKEKKVAPPREYVKGKGTVKSVPSGDTIFVVFMEKNKPPVEKEITLSNIFAPKLGRRRTNNKEATEDESFAWQSREYLRKLAVGQHVSYTIEHTTNGRNYGIVHLIKKDKEEDLAELVVSEGWAKVKKPAGNINLREDVAVLVDLEEKANKANKGLWSKDKSNSVRQIHQTVDTQALFEQFKGKAQTGIVEKVLTGSQLRVTLLPSLQEVIVYLSGVECPMVRQKGEKLDYEPYGREAKFCTEYYLLNREVPIIFEGVDKFNLYASISSEAGNTSEELLKRGLGKYVDWSGQRTAFSSKLREAEKQAKEKKLGIWSTVTDQKPLSRQEEKKQMRVGKEILGKVVEIVNSGLIVVVDNASQPHKISLSSVKNLRGGSMQPPDYTKKGEPSDQAASSDQDVTPAAGNEKETISERKRREAIERTFAWEAKEYLRKRLIGQKVRCVVDYIKPGLPDAKGNPGPDRAYFSVYFEKNNVAVELVTNGLARPVDHRGGEQRSKDYEDMLKAASLAQKVQKGLHNPKAAPTYINDVSLLDANKAKQLLPLVKKAGKQRGVVEYEFSASRLKVFVPKESIELILNLSGISTPTRDSEFSKEALVFTRDLVHQHDIEFEILSQDRNGNFIGHVWINKENLAVLLLQAGYAEIIRSVMRDSDFRGDYTTAEDYAKKQHKNIWKDYDEQKEAEARKKRQEEMNEQRKSSKQEFIDVIVTEIIDANTFYVQIVGPDAEKLEDLMKHLAEQELGDPHTPQVKELVKAQFTADDAWYRARVVGTTPEGDFKVFYIDYGNTETIPVSRIRKLSPEDSKLPPQAHEAHLAYIKAPKIDDEYGPEAAEFVKELVENKTMMAHIEYREGDSVFLSLGDRESQVHVNAALLRAGLARVERVRGRHLQPLIEKLREEENKARVAHTYIWEYGDPGSDEDEERPTMGKKDKPQAKPKSQPKTESKKEEGKTGKEEAKEE